jgi:glycosyltransferase involved in cell wall biosynthesis
MRALFISHHFPHDPSRSVYGVFKRMGLFIEAALREVDELDMLFFVPWGIDTSPAAAAEMEEQARALWGANIHLSVCRQPRHAGATSNWEQYGAGIFDVFRQEGHQGMNSPEAIAALERCLDRQPAWVLAHRLQAMGPLMATRRALPPVLLDLDDIEHLAHARRVLGFPRWPGERLKLLHTPALRAAELRALRFAACSFVCSDKDRDYLRGRAGSPQVETIPNAVEMPADGPDASQGGTDLMFLGAFVHRPNVQAAEHLIDAIWPRVLQHLPGARLLIAGGKPERVRQHAAPPAGVEFLGFVDDLPALYAQAAVVCCPLLTGAGTRIKIIEAAAHGKAIVSTTLGAEGLQFRDGSEILLRDGAERFAQACVQLLQDPAARQLMGTAARAQARLQYDRSAVVAGIRAHMARPVLT